MAGQKGRDMLLKIGDAASPEVFTTIGGIRTNGLTINNNPIDDTCMDSAGVQSMVADAGIQTMQISVDGLFKDGASEETLRAAAYARTAHTFQLLFPNGDDLEATFVIQDYSTTGAHDDLQTASFTLVKSGAHTYTSA